MSQPLDLLDFPLRGSHLIEASAGTGKTWTIAGLVLRLVLGHGDAERGPGRPLLPQDILVVTFTDAATRELRDRIRARLAEAARAFEQPAEGPFVGDALLAALRAAYPPEHWPACALRAQLASESVDEAAVLTIHGWCQRMLREHAFDSGSLFEQQLDADGAELKRLAAQDWWRQQAYAVADADASAFLALFPDPETLLAEVQPLLPYRDALPVGASPAATMQAQGARLAALKAPWQDGGWIAEIEALLDAARARKAFDGRALKQPDYQSWLRKLADWAGSDAIVPALTDAAWGRLTPDGLSAIWKQPPAPAHPGFAAIAALRAATERLATDSRESILCHAAHGIAAAMRAEQQRRAVWGFDDLLTALDAALAGPAGARLAAQIRRQYPVVLIDEFQDTDPVQYRIFDAIYRIAEPHPDTATILIGDPKQAIYGFRGADIHSYLAARRATAGRHWTLATNYRSTTAMVAAVNALFGQAAAPFAVGAAIDPAALPFQPVAAHGRRERFVLDGDDTAGPPLVPAALTLWHERAAPATADERLRRLADGTTEAIVTLLLAAREGRCGFDPDPAVETGGGAAARRRPLRPADIAVLVNKAQEAEAVRASLLRRGVASVYLSDRESVFETAVARELLDWLEACARPDDPRRLRAALASATLGLDWAALAALDDEAVWEAQVLRFRDYRERWRRQGVLAMLRRLLHDHDVPARLLAAGDERRLTDLQHLAELLQQASLRLDGETALIRYLRRELDAPQASADNDECRVRLESDAERVKVVTVHKSKGLEYPLVFLPFAQAYRAVDGKKPPLVWHEADGSRRLRLSADADSLRRADDERLAEDLRKLYVALTRARHVTWMALLEAGEGGKPLPDFTRSAPGHLLRPAEPPLATALATLAAGSAGAIAVTPLPTPTATRWADGSAPPPLRTAPPYTRPAQPRWWIASYSALARAQDRQIGGGPAPDGPEAAAWLKAGLDAETGIDAAVAAAADADPDPDAGATVGRGQAYRAAGRLDAFARGAEAGTFLHGLFEWIAERGFAATAAEPEPLREEIARRCALRGWTAQIEPLHAALTDWLRLPIALPDADAGAGTARVALAELATYQAEAEFWLPVAAAEAEALDRLITRHTLSGAPRPALAPTALNGMLKGYIDLVFEHGGRYYVADYKSNHLGADAAAYVPARLAACVREHRYDVQYALYLFALHRLLRSRLPDYDYDRHVGGAVYLFLRGHAADGHGVHGERPPAALMAALDACFDGEPAP